MMDDESGEPMEEELVPIKGKGELESWRLV